MKTIKINNFNDIPENYTGIAIDGHKNKYWLLNGFLHRKDGPSVVDVNGHKEYWLNGKLHREDGSAIEEVNGFKEYWINGKRHREDGPAVENVGGYKQYWFNGKLLSNKNIDFLLNLGYSVETSIKLTWHYEQNKKH